MLITKLKEYRSNFFEESCSIEFGNEVRKWNYLYAGEGERNLLLLPSGIHFSEMWFPIVPGLKDDFKILSPSYPGVSGMDEMINGIISLMDELGIKKSSVLGMSTSGWIAQTLVRRHPERFENLLILNSSGPDKIDVNQLERAFEMAKNSTRALVELSHKKYYHDSILDSRDRRFLENYLTELLNRTEDEEVLGLYRLSLDFVKESNFKESDLDNWSGRVLIVLSDNDQGYNEEHKMDLISLYREAKVVNLKNAGHTPVFNTPEVLIEIIREFLIK